MNNYSEVYSVVNQSQINTKMIQRCLDCAYFNGNNIILPDIISDLFVSEIRKIARAGQSTKNVLYFELDGICLKIADGGCIIRRYC